MTVFGDTWDYLTTAANWTGDGGMLELLVEQLLLSVTALAHGDAGRAPDRPARSATSAAAASSRSTSPTSAARSRPSRCWPSWSPPTGPAPTSFGPYGRAGLATLIALTLFALPPLITNAYVAVREVPGDVKESADGHGHDRPPAVLPGRAAARAAAGGVRASGWRWCRCGRPPPSRPWWPGPGLGRVITDGFYRTNYGKGIAGAIVVAAVALVLELIAAQAQRLTYRAPSIVTES